MSAKTKCPWCPKKYQSFNDLISHAKKVHGVNSGER